MKVLPRTRTGVQKKLDAFQKTGVNTRQDAVDYAQLMLKSIELDIANLKECTRTNPDNPLLQGLLERYEPLRTKWESRLKWAQEHINEPLNS